MGSVAEIWVVSDGKPGHLNQSMGLAEALQSRHSHLNIVIKSPLSWREAGALLFKKWPLRPALIIGAGHRTHLSLLLLKRATGAPAVVMMSPSLPLAWFDLCLVPAHDGPSERSNVVETRGALNRMVAANPEEKRQHGMILVGGPSDHFHWHNQSVLAQIQGLISAGGDWLLTTSRRTPADFVPALQKRQHANLTIVPFEQTGSDWLGTELPRAGQCWVTPDSVSMVYEAMTAGCAVGVFDLKPKKLGRVVRGLLELQDGSRVVNFSQWQQGIRPVPLVGFNEAERCADIVADRFLGKEGVVS